MVTEASATFVPSNGLDVERWVEQHSDGSGPGGWPYGLDRLEAFGVEPLWQAGDKAGLFDVVRLFGGRSGQVSRVDSAFAWDERGALRMLNSVAAKEYKTGIIWLNDRRSTDLRRILFRGLVGRMRDVWVLSTAQLAPMRSLLGNNGKTRLHWVPFGIDNRFFREGISSRTGEKGPLVISAGNDRDRDYETLLRAIPEVRRRVPNARFLIQTRRRFEVPEGCVLVEQVSHAKLRELYGEASVTVVPTRPNLHGSGMTVMLEAMAAGSATLVTRTPGIESYVPDVGDYTTPAGDSEELASRIVSRLHDPAWTEQLGARGSSYITENHSVEVMIRAIARILKGEAEGDA